nr:MAG: RNA helicase [Hubei picorna-like virus 55]
MSCSKALEQGRIMPQISWVSTYKFVKNTIETWLVSLVENFLSPSEVTKILMQLVFLITNIIVNVVTLFKSSTGVTMRLLSGANLLVTFQLVASAIANGDVGFDTNRASDYLECRITELEEEYADRVFPNSAHAEVEQGWVQTTAVVFTAVFTAILAGYGISTKGIDGLTSVFRSFTATKNGVSSIKEIVQEAIKLIAEDKYDPVNVEKTKIRELTEEAQELVRLNIGAIACDNAVKERFRTIIKDINQALLSFRHPDSANMRSLLGTLCTDLNKKLSEVDSLIPTRQVTAGVFLLGDPGVGKSTLAAYISKVMAKEFGWRDSIYNVSPGVRFYEPYLNEDFGIVNEFASTVTPDLFSTDANRICSSDPFNFESAGLSGKVSMCRLKMLFVTSNNWCPEIRELLPDSIPAFWDRFIIFEVKDPKIENRRMRAYHRKEDFSHLTFNIVEQYSQRGEAFKFRYVFKDLTVFDVMEILRTKLALETIAFHKRVEQPLPVDFKEDILKAANPPEGSYAYKYFGFDAVVQPNAVGRNFCILRLQGPEGTGKTTIAKKIAEKWQKLTKSHDGPSRYKIQLSQSLKDFTPEKKPHIYILDDWVSSNMTVTESEEYVKKMNSTTTDSIFVITTNEVIKRRMPWFDLGARLVAIMLNNEYEYPYLMDNFSKLYPGIRRRIGLDKLYLCEGKLHQLPSLEFCLTIDTTTNGHIKHNYNNVGVSYILEHLKKKYMAMLEDRYNVVVLNHRPETEQTHVDFELIVDSTETLFSKLRTSLGASSLFLNPTSKASLKVSDRIVEGVMNVNPEKSIRPSDFVCTEIFKEEVPLQDRYSAIVERITRVLLQYFSDPTFRVTIKQTKECVYSEKGVVYYYKDDDTDIVTIKGEDILLQINTPKLINAVDFARSLSEDKLESKFQDSLKQLTTTEYLVLEDYFKRSIRKQAFNPFITRVIKEEMKFKRLKDPSYINGLLTIKSNKVLVATVCVLVGATTLGGIYALYKLVRPMFQEMAKKETVVDNAFANTGSTPPKRAMENQSLKDKRNLGATVTTAIKSNSIHSKHRGKVIPNYKSNKSSSGSEEELIINSPHTKHRGKVIPNMETAEILETVQPTDKTLNEQHEHICKSCSCLYIHSHKMNKNFIHPQHSKQCPNYLCKEYHNGFNKSNAVLIQLNFIETSLEPLTPNALAKIMGEEFSYVKTGLLKFFSTLTEEQRKQVYDEIHQAKRGNDRTFKRLTRRYPQLEEYVQRVIKANMLCEADMIESPESELEALHRKLTKCYVQVSYAGFKAYALHVGKGMFLCVSHCFDEVGRTVLLKSENVSYPSIVLSIVRERDLAVVYCKDLNNLPSGKKYFTRDSNNLSLAGYFMRCGPQLAIVSGNLEYKEYQEFIDGSCSNEHYKPCMEVLKLRRVGLMVEEIIKKGDCGFPFMCKVGGSIKLIGFHNAYKTHAIVYGSFISQPLIDELCEVITPNADIPSPITVVRVPVKRENEETIHIEMSMPHEYAREFLNCIKPDPMMPLESTLTSIGYNPKFKNFNNMKEKHYTHEIELENPNMQLPAAFTNRYVTDFSEITLNGKGIPDPLWTQAMKYGTRKKNYDEDIFRHAVEMVVDYNKLTYCNSKPFKMLTEFEALNGRTEPFLSNVDIKTSAGPYAKYFYGIMTKQEFLEITYHDEKPIYSFAHNKIGQNIRNHLKTQRSLLENYGIPPCLISQDNAKVENIDKEKAEKGKVRLFNNVDPSINALLKIMFGDWFSRAMAKSSEGYYAIGQNPYTTSTEIWHRFSTKQGKILNTDFKAFDKLLITELIEAFCYIAGRLTKNERLEELPMIYDALALTLTHAIHLLNGSVYVVHNGNESGTFVTTLLNCVSVHIIFNYSFIKCWNKVPHYIGIKPMLNDIMSRSELAILGDDKTQIVSKDIPMTEEELIEIAASLGMECTPAKGGEDSGNEINFCSRVLEWNEHDQVVYPKLKKSSIIGLLYWFVSFEKNQVRDNLMICLFEASLHDEAFYDSVFRDAMVVATAMGVDIRTIPFTNYQQSRKRLRSMLMNDFEYQQISELAVRKTKLFEDFCELSKFLKVSRTLEDKVETASAAQIVEYKELQDCSRVLRKRKSSTAKRITREQVDEGEMASFSHTSNPISACNELISKLKLDKPIETYERTGSDHEPTYSCTLRYTGREFGGTGPSKTSAKTQAFGALRVFLDDNIICNAACEEQVQSAHEKIKKTAITAFCFIMEAHLKAAKSLSDGKKYVIIVASRLGIDNVEEIGGYIRFYRNGNCYVLSPIIERLGRKTAAACYARYPGVTYDTKTKEVTYDVHASTSQYVLRDIDEKTYSDEDGELVANATRDIPIVGEEDSGTPGKMPVTSVMDSDKAMYQPIVMNRSAPNNSWLKAGGITFNISDLAYNQFVGCNKQVQISDGKAAGSILAQIPYDPVSNEFANAYIQNLVLLHGRMTGDWMVKITCPGNPGMQCSIGVAWVPSKIAGETIQIDQATKYAFFTTGVSSEWSHTIVMTDARQSSFYRTIQRDSKKTTVTTDDMPHVVVYCETPATSVFTEKKSTFLTFFSKLCDEKDLLFNPSIKPFVLADPQASVKFDATKGYTLNF